MASQSDFSTWLVDSMRCGVVAIDAAGVITAFNSDARRVLGCEGEVAALLGRSCESVLAGQSGLVSLLRGALRGHEQPARSEHTLASRPGRHPCTIGYTLCAVRDADGEVCGSALFFRDLTPIERADERERLRGRLAALGEMAAGLAHEIRNPLASMQVLAGLLKRRLPQAGEERSLLDGIMREIRSVESVVGRTLDSVRSDWPQHETLDLCQLVELSLERALARVAYKGTIQRDYPEDVPRLEGDASQLASALSHLFENALEAMRDADSSGEQRLSLTLGTECVAGVEEISLSVADSGPGVAEGLRERVFYPFFTTKESGSGVGLATAQKIVASHGGRLSVHTAPGGGALFRVQLPLCGGRAPRAGAGVGSDPRLAAS